MDNLEVKNSYLHWIIYSLPGSVVLYSILVYDLAALGIMRGIMAKKKEKEQVLGIVTQYMKDLSFENVNAASRNEEENNTPQIDMQLKVNVEKSKEKNVYSVSLVTNIQAKTQQPLFILDLTYTGEFVIEGFPDEMLNPILYIECPRLLFPFVRSIIASAVSEGGFPPLYLDPVNFANLYQQQNESLSQTLQ
ncbi:MAG: protein-export chaperone SecB [Holosporaceae bacterium]|jgi:preprotein translocase subunit SecB|nr:protein-export chaperone SecB [Holosporaceae bacterium]